MSDDRLRLRPGTNVGEEIARDALVRRAQKIRAAAVVDKNTIEYWNRAHPDQPPFDTSFEDAVIAWCDGKGPFPTPPEG